MNFLFKPQILFNWILRICELLRVWIGEHKNKFFVWQIIDSVDYKLVGYWIDIFFIVGLSSIMKIRDIVVFNLRSLYFSESFYELKLSKSGHVRTKLFEDKIYDFFLVRIVSTEIELIEEFIVYFGIKYLIEVFHFFFFVEIKFGFLR